jgi:hypothetical protein
MVGSQQVSGNSAAFAAHELPSLNVAEARTQARSDRAMGRRAVDHVGSRPDKHGGRMLGQPARPRAGNRPAPQRFPGAARGRGVGLGVVLVPVPYAARLGLEPVRDVPALAGSAESWPSDDL